MCDLDEYVRKRGITDDEMREARKATHVTEPSTGLDRFVPESEFTHGGAAKALAKVMVGEPVVVMRHGVPAYVIITPDEYRDYEALREKREDAADLALAASPHGTVTTANSGLSSRLWTSWESPRRWQTPSLTRRSSSSNLGSLVSTRGRA